MNIQRGFNVQHHKKHLQIDAIFDKNGLIYLFNYQFISYRSLYCMEPIPTE